MSLGKRKVVPRISRIFLVEQQIIGDSSIGAKTRYKVTTTTTNNKRITQISALATLAAAAVPLPTESDLRRLFRLRRRRSIGLFG